VPELQKVANNVQFEEIRDEALKALANLTKALGDAYEVDEATKAKKMAEEQARVAAEQHRIQAERDAQARRDAEIQKREEEERRRFKEAMDAQRELDKIAEHEAEVKRQEEALKRDQEMRSTKAADGKCQGCGLKKCKKTCFFYAG
jgi:DNA repair exonuclease SbcCD ATPase subunit